jgi:phosphoenolpyruvate synthase/pyruvate phosphate dikinase
MNSVISLHRAGDKPIDLVGGKARALGQLIDFGAPVPPGYVVPPEANIYEASSEILAAFDKLGNEFVAVRSSAAGEDSKSQSWAGQFESYLYVTRGQLLQRINDCRASGHSARTAAYDAGSSNMPVAVVVQTMVPADVAGVLFTANPVTRDRRSVMVEAVYGLGEQLVQGLATPDNFILDRTGRILHQTITSKTSKLSGSPDGIVETPIPAGFQQQPALTPEQLAGLTTLAVKLESDFGHPLDIEFALAHGKLWVVQARPITTI